MAPIPFPPNGVDRCQYEESDTRFRILSSAIFYYEERCVLVRRTASNARRFSGSFHCAEHEGQWQQEIQLSLEGETLVYKAQGDPSNFPNGMVQTVNRRCQHAQ